MPQIVIVMGSDADLPVLEPAFAVFRRFPVSWEARVISAHRTPVEAFEFAGAARANGVQVIIAAAGKAAHLAGVLAASTTLPVIGLPVGTSGMGGMDALLSTVQMPSGVPVATVAVDGAENAAWLALEIIGLSDVTVTARLEEERQRMGDKVRARDVSVREHYKSTTEMPTGGLE
ncbi:5-(carboxyamino)imidazole ribonucleotide mutase [bacterium]|nr:5-(carboxyamino)imidazole ribonucleotide mutase [bacterium]